jgi:hypothetical protein
MTALGNVPCNGCRACCLHDMIPLMPERGDQIWTYKHEVIATAGDPATGDFRDATVLRKFGDVPNDLSAL